MLHLNHLDQTLQSTLFVQLLNGLKQLKRAEEVAALRGISVSDLA